MAGDARAIAVRNGDVAFAATRIAGALRDDVLALWALDEAVADAFAHVREPMLAGIRMKWWEDAIRQARRGEAPAIDAAIAAVARRKLDASVLATLAQAWSLIANEHSRGSLHGFATLRGGTLFAMSATALGKMPNAELEHAGMVWALADYARRASDPNEADNAVMSALERRAASRTTLPPFLKVLANLAEIDLRNGSAARGSPRRRRDLFRALF